MKFAGNWKKFFLTAATTGRGRTARWRPQPMNDVLKYGSGGNDVGRNPIISILLILLKFRKFAFKIELYSNLAKVL